MKISRILQFSLKVNKKKTESNFPIQQNKAEMRFYGKFPQDYKFSEEIFLFRRLTQETLKKMASDVCFPPN